MIFVTLRRFLPSIALAAALGTCAVSARADALVDFEDLSLPPNSHFEGADPSPYDWTPADNPWSSRGMVFHNLWAQEHYEFPAGSGIFYDFTTWQGQTYSNHTWSGAPPGGLAGQYTAYPGAGAGGSANYAVIFRTSEDVIQTGLNSWDATSYATLDLPPGEQVQSLRVANSAYAWDTITNGDPYGFSRRFGWLDADGNGSYGDPGDYAGNYPDWFLLSIAGLDAAGQPIAASPVDVYLADYRAADPAGDFILEDWQLVDLSGLAGAAKLEFRLKSTDVGPYGMNTPGYFMIDDIRFGSSVVAAVPEPSSLALAAAGSAALAGLRLARRRRKRTAPAR